MEVQGAEEADSVHCAIVLWQELIDLSRELDQDVSIFLCEATEGWLRKAC